MDSLIRRTFSVLLVTSVTAFAVYAFVSLEGGLFTRGSVATAAAAGSVRGAATRSAAADGSAGLYTCPATGCTATNCHATDPGAPGPGSQQSTAQGDVGSTGGSRGQASSGSGDGSVGGSSGDSGVYTCPATGCTATYCHAASGSGRGPGVQRGDRHASTDG